MKALSGRSKPAAKTSRVKRPGSTGRAAIELARGDRCRRIVEMQEELISLTTRDGQFVYANQAFGRLYDKTPEDLVGLNIFSHVPIELHDELRRKFDEVLRTSKPNRMRNEVFRPGGRRYWIAWTNFAFAEPNGAKLILSVGRDIHDEVETERRLVDSEARYRLLAEASTDAVMALDRNLVRTYVSPASFEIFGFRPEELIGAKTAESAHPDDREGLQRALQGLLDGEAEKYIGLNRRRHRDGRWIWAETCYRSVRDGAGQITGIVASVRDVTARKESEIRLAEAYERLSILAGEDGLTRLANRRSFDEALEKEHKRASRGEGRLCLIMIDVDRFKAFNDSYGHPAGDECLRKVAAAIKSCLRRANDLAVRYGGEEFAVMSPGIDEKGGFVVAERIRNAVRDLEIEHERSEHGYVTVSVGVASASRQEFLRSRSTLLDRADAALYKAKDKGRHRVELASSLVVLKRTS